MAKDLDFGALKVRAEGVLDDITDGTLMVLKGHLLLEEVLFDRVCAKCVNPQYIEKAGFKFRPLLQIARALYKGPRQEAFWDSMEALNTLRNQMAHRLEHKDLLSLLRRLQIRHKKGAVSLSDPELVNALGISIAMLLGMAASLGSMDKSEEKPLQQK